MTAFAFPCGLSFLAVTLTLAFTAPRFEDRRRRDMNLLTACCILAREAWLEDETLIDALCLPGRRNLRAIGVVELCRDFVNVHCSSLNRMLGSCALDALRILGGGQDAGRAGHPCPRSPCSSPSLMGVQRRHTSIESEIRRQRADAE